MLNDKEIYEVGMMILDGASVRSITRSSRIGNHTLKNFKERLNTMIEAQSDWKLMDSEKRRVLCYPRAVPAVLPVNPQLHELFEKIHQRLIDRRCHYSIYQGWLDYRKVFPEGWQRTQFYTNYRKWEETHHPGRLASAPVERQPGKYLYIDWIGDQIVYVKNPQDPDKKMKAHFLVFTLGYSSLTYAAAFPDEKMERVVEGINRALWFYGALPLALRPDNMKTAVTSNTREGVVLSTAMEDLQDYYDIPVVPARPLHPKDKASVERAVLILETELLSRLAPNVFETFEDLNSEVLRFLDDLNTRIKTGESMSRIDLYKRFDLPQMKPLPDKLFAYREYKQLTVQRNCHIKHGNVYYSVPFQYVGQKVIAKISSAEIEICDSGNRPICRHKIAGNNSARYVTVESHLKSNYQIQRQIDRDGVSYYINQAARIGPNMKAFIETLIEMYRYEEQSYNSCQAIIQSCRKVSSVIAEQVASACLQEGKIGYRHFTEALKERKKGLTDSGGRGEREKEESSQNKHSNIRGKEYYDD